MTIHLLREPATEPQITAIINLRPRTNPSMEIQDPAMRGQVEAIARRLLQRT